MQFIEYYHEHQKRVRLIDKEKSWLMRVINWFLMLAGKLNLSSIKGFMTDYVTTIGRTIYASPAWTLYFPNTPLTIHELCHVEQWSLWYAITYVLSPKKRMLAESTCVQAEMLCFPEKYNANVIDFERINERARQFVAYGVPYKTSVDYLVARQKEVFDGKPQPAAASIHKLWERWENAESSKV